LTLESMHHKPKMRAMPPIIITPNVHRSHDNQEIN